MQSKADTGQWNLRTAPATKKVDRQKILKVKKRMCSEVSVTVRGIRGCQFGRGKGRLRWEGFAEKNEGFKPGMKD